MTANVLEGCILCGICASTCPEVFSLESETAVALPSEVPSEVQASAIEARNGCPVNVIELGGA